MCHSELLSGSQFWFLASTFPLEREKTKRKGTGNFYQEIVCPLFLGLLGHLNHDVIHGNSWTGPVHLKLQHRHRGLTRSSFLNAKGSVKLAKRITAQGKVAQPPRTIVLGS